MATKTSNTKKRRIYWLLGGLMVLLLAAVWIKGGSKTKAIEVDAQTVARRSIQERVSASGKVYPSTEVKVSSDVSGEVVELFVEEGDTVRAGQILAKIDPEAYISAVERGEASVLTARAQEANSKAGIEQARSQKEQIEAQLANQRELHRRNEKLHREKVISDVEFEQSQAALRGLEANLRAAEASIRSAQELARGAAFSVRSAEASLKEIRTSLRRTAIVAPMDGVVSLLNVKKGERVVGTMQMAGTEIMRIADFSEIEVQADVSENDILRVSIGDEAEVEVDAYLGRVFKGRVIQIANSSGGGGLGASLGSDQATNFVVKVLIDPSSYRDITETSRKAPFRPGMSASVDILTNTVADVLSVPIQAVTTREREQEDDQGQGSDMLEVVFLIEGDTVRMQEVETGIQDDTWIEVKSGLTGDEKVVSGPYAAVSRKLESGKRVSIRKKQDNAAAGKEKEE